MKSLTFLIRAFVLLSLSVVLLHRYQQLNGCLILRTADDSTIVEQVTATESTEPVYTEPVHIPTEAVNYTEPAYHMELTEPAYHMELTEPVTEPFKQTEPPTPTELKPTPEPANPPNSSSPPSTTSKYDDDEDYSGFVGRLRIPDAGIDVALYRGSSQSITDRKDSANIFRWKDYSGEVIADHSNQDFSKLSKVKVGYNGYIKLKDGNRIGIECVAVCDGHNTGDVLTDDDGNNVMGQSDYVMYTCMNGWQNVRICLWNII